jgi:hypothetical protein
VKLCRSVTSDEIDHLHELGWVKLRSFVHPEVLHTLLAVARELMGEDGDSNAPPLTVEARLGLRPSAPASDAGHAGTDAAVQDDEPFPHYNPQRGSALSKPAIRPLIYEIGGNAKQLQRRTGADGRGVDVRYYGDYFAPKLPAAQQTRHGGNRPTAFHQDFISHAVDRSGGLTFWFALEPLDPESGTMSFVNRSHRMGVLGHTMTYGDGDVLDGFPELRELEMSEPMTYGLGDVTVHDHLTVHGAGANLTDRPRWAYLLLTQPADILWNGSPCPNFEWTAMKPWQPFSDDVLPVIS